MAIEKLLKQIRGRDSLREASEKTGLSHTYISILEKGIDPRTKSPLHPSPETLRAYSKGYNYSYEELMKSAGYMDAEDNKERDESAPISDVTISVMNKLIEKHGADFSDPEAAEMLEQLVKMVAKMQKKDVN